MKIASHNAFDRQWLPCSVTERWLHGGLVVERLSANGLRCRYLLLLGED